MCHEYYCEVHGTLTPIHSYCYLQTHGLCNAFLHSVSSNVTLLWSGLSCHQSQLWDWCNARQSKLDINLHSLYIVSARGVAFYCNSDWANWHSNHDHSNDIMQVTTWDTINVPLHWPIGACTPTWLLLNGYSTHTLRLLCERLQSSTTAATNQQPGSLPSYDLHRLNHNCQHCTCTQAFRKHTIRCLCVCGSLSTRLRIHTNLQWCG